MFEFILLILVAQIIPSNILRVSTEAYDKKSDYTKTEIRENIKGQGSTPNLSELYEREGFHKKKEGNFDKKHSYEVGEKPYKKENKFKEHNKIKGYETGGSISPRELELPKDIRKKNNYEKRENDYEDPQRIKNVNYHDKNRFDEKERNRKGREISEHTKPPSLHRDVDVNYLGFHSDIPNDTEFVSVESAMGTEKRKDHVQNYNEINEKKPKINFYQNLKKFDMSTTPSTNDSALVARYIVHIVDWTSISTLSANTKLKGGPFVNIISVSDGPSNEGSGIPFFYMTPKDLTSIDLNKNNRCTIVATLAQTDQCKMKHIDPENPLCARLILSGKIKKVKPGTEEENFAKHALFSRHPEMESWPSVNAVYFRCTSEEIVSTGYRNLTTHVL